MKKIILCIVMLLCLTFFVNAKNIEQDVTLRVEFDKVGNCTSDYNTTHMIISISDKDGNREYRDYNWKCGKFPQNKGGSDMIPNVTNDTETVTKTLNFDVDSESFCSETTNALYSGIKQNLSYCYSSLQKLTSMEETCIDTSQQAGEYRAKYESCDKDYSECSGSLTTIKGERDSLDQQVNNCQKDLDVSNTQKSSCQGEKSTCDTDKAALKEKADKTAMYCIIAALAGFGAAYYHFNGGKKNPDNTYDEQEFQRQG